MYACTVCIEIKVLTAHTYTAPGVVQFYVTTTMNNTEVTVKWSPPLQPNGIITSYKVIYQRYEDDSTTVYIKLESSVRNYTIQSLRKCAHMPIWTSQQVDVLIPDPGTPYQVRVVAFTSVGMGVLGDYVAFFSEELTPTKPPENVHANWLSPTRINVTWTPLNLFEAQGFPQYRAVLSLLSNDQERRQIDSVASNNSFVLFDDLDNTIQHYVVVGVRTGGSVTYVDSATVSGRL